MTAASQTTLEITPITMSVCIHSLRTHIFFGTQAKYQRPVQNTDAALFIYRQIDIAAS